MTAAISSGAASDRNVARQLGLLLVGRTDADVGVDGTGGDGVDRDTRVGDFTGQGLGESEDRGLGR